MNKVDIFVGHKIRSRRLALGKTQAELGNMVGVQFQQIQKYESGANRVSASRLWAIAEALGTPIEFFFEGMDVPATDTHTDDSATLRVMRDFQKLSAPQKRAVSAIVRSMANEEPAAPPDTEKQGA